MTLQPVGLHGAGEQERAQWDPSHGSINACNQHARRRSVESAKMCLIVIISQSSLLPDSVLESVYLRGAHDLASLTEGEGLDNLPV